MKQKIKFRTWNNKTKWMSDVFTFNELLEFGFNLGNNKLPKDNLSFKDCIIMQFTGLKDKNGKEIYEGDILLSPSDCEIRGGCKYCSKIHKPEWVEVVGFGKYEDVYNGNEIIGFYFEFHDIHGKERIHKHSWFDTSTKIIGNIYENPELICKENKK